MELIKCTTKRPGVKLKAIVEAFPDIWRGCVLDVGCRGKELRAFLPREGCRYYGLDLFSPADVIVNLEEGLPFADRGVEQAAALDVLEHTDRMHACLEEILRVCANHVVIALPNFYHWRNRIGCLRGRTASGKYRLSGELPQDRHKWLFSVSEARLFCRGVAEKNGFRVLREALLLGRAESLLVPDAVALRFPGLFAPTYVTVLRRE